MGANHTLAHLVATEFIRDYASDFTTEHLDPSGPQMLYNDFSHLVRRKIIGFSAADLGIIAANGKARGQGGGTSLYLVHCGRWLNNEESGIELLREIAVTAIIAKAYDLLMQPPSAA